MNDPSNYFKLLTEGTLKTNSNMAFTSFVQMKTILKVDNYYIYFPVSCSGTKHYESRTHVS